MLSREGGRTNLDYSKKVKFILEQATKAKKVIRYISTLSLTSALDGVGGQIHAPVALPPGKRPAPIAQEAGWAPGPVWTVGKNLALAGV